MNTSRVDYAIYDQLGQLRAVAEAKRKSGTSTEWARNWFRNSLAHGKPVPSYLLLATPDRIYLWRTQPSGETPSSPYEMNAVDVFSDYFHRSHLRPAQTSPQAFELIVGSWLNDLLGDRWEPSKIEQRKTLIESGFLDAVKNGRVESGVAA